MVPQTHLYFTATSFRGYRYVHARMFYGRRQSLRKRPTTYTRILAAVNLSQSDPQYFHTFLSSLLTHIYSTRRGGCDVPRRITLAISLLWERRKSTYTVRTTLFERLVKCTRTRTSTSTAAVHHVRRYAVGPTVTISRHKRG